MPETWAAKLREWRGIYLIVDESDGTRYIGAACGNENILGRWRAHVAQGHGVTVELADRASSMFRFSILERVSPDMEAEGVVTLETTWKYRLDTLRYGANAP